MEPCLERKSRKIRTKKGAFEFAAMLPWIIELIPAILVIMLAVVFVAMGLWFLSSSKGEETPTGNTGGILLNSSLLFPTGHTDSEMATCIDSYIVKYAPSSYLVGHGADFVSAGNKKFRAFIFDIRFKRNSMVF